MNYFETGNLHFNKGEFQEAIEYYLLELSKNTQDIRTLINLGSSYYELKKYEKSLEIASHILAIDPSNTDALVNRGHCYQALNRFAEAEAEFSRLIEIDPFVDIYYLYRANARRYLGRSNDEEHDKKVYEFLQENNLNPILSTDFIDRAEEIDTQHFKKTVIRFIDIIVVDPYNYVAYFDLGLAYTKILAYKSAIDAYTKALTLHPKIFKDALFNRANAYYDNKQFEESLADIATYAKEFSSNPYLEQIKERIYTDQK